MPGERRRGGAHRPEDPSPMKRGLKGDYGAKGKYTAADPEDPSPMKRGLKGYTRQAFDALSWT